MLWKSFKPIALANKMTRTWAALVNTWHSQMYILGSVQAMQNWSPSSNDAIQWVATELRAEERQQFCSYLFALPQCPEAHPWVRKHWNVLCPALTMNWFCKRRQKWFQKTEHEETVVIACNLLGLSIQLSKVGHSVAVTARTWRELRVGNRWLWRCLKWVAPGRKVTDRKDEAASLFL